MSGPAKTSSWQQTYIYGTFYICFFGLFVPSKLLWSFLRALRLLFTCLKTDSGCCAGDMPYSCPICGLESHINLTICSEFFDRTVVSGVSCQAGHYPPTPALWLVGVEPNMAGYSDTIQYKYTRQKLLPTALSYTNVPLYIACIAHDIRPRPGYSRGAVRLRSIPFAF